ncbi:hypothetical protein [Helicobacter heilmannii]|uniref:hypothetical protein n=1 Tax=Helicobacter heilmannii TaxID=35817 RepID=UPI00028B14B8|nr:hypothetical protein [Helicobacter heilmannii]CCM73274.1 hypothetical protein BN341_920 [Helicobacter heilmannii ASB1.4]CRF45315.1 hypothetical protein HHE014_02770 [Helicobacter heilmannii]CRF46778.1 hypothetical protein HHE02_00420 [Helicobacter heilmannii]CRF49373.1 hypothetical protein HHE03_09830 [Helicobacter heilmannii]CRF51577.1 hypothetical protein HHE06_14640 [Helicobacter heilmannii]
MRLQSVIFLPFLIAPVLLAENNGVYGEVGFQYSNMTKASKEGQQMLTTPLQQRNPLKGIVATKPILVPPQPNK